MINKTNNYNLVISTDAYLLALQSVIIQEDEDLDRRRH